MVSFVHNHVWGWPRKMKDAVGEFDSYQACSGCGAERLYDFKRMAAGPRIDGLINKGGKRNEQQIQDRELLGAELPSETR